MALTLISWWYTAGWARLGKRVVERMASAMEFFSVGLLARTLFDPFRQIAAARVQGSMRAQLKAFNDRLFSRFIGAAVRSIFIFIGLTSTLVMGVVGVVQFVLWPLVPLMPVIGIALAVTGWAP